MTLQRLLLATSLMASGVSMAWADDDRFRLQGSLYHSDGSVALGAAGEGEILGQDWIFDDQVGLDGQQEHAYWKLMWRLSERQRLWGSYYEFDHGRRYELQEPLAFDEWPDAALPAGTYVEGGLDFKLATLMYDYAVVQTPRHTVGLQAGVHWAHLGAYVEAGIPGEGEARAEWERRRHAVALGARYQFEPSERWRWSAEVQGFDTGWGNFVSEDGYFVRANVQGEYRFHEHWGVHAGYDWFELVLRDEAKAGPVTADVEGRLRVHGPFVGLTASF